MSKTINLFISQPMSGLTSDEIQKERDRIADNYCLQFGKSRDDIVVVNQIEYNELCSDEKHGPLTFLGLAIQRLAIADVVIFHNSWINARGCNVEHEIVSRYSNDYNWTILYDYDILGLSEINPRSKAANLMLNGRIFDKAHLKKETEDWTEEDCDCIGCWECKYFRQDKNIHNPYDEKDAYYCSHKKLYISGNMSRPDYMDMRYTDFNKLGCSADKE